MKISHFILFSLYLFCLTGCDPEERTWWSPNGENAAVIIDSKLFLTDSDGKIIGSALQVDPGEVSTEEIAWLPDGSGLVAIQVREIEDWEEARTLLSKEEVERTEALADTMQSILRSLALLEGDDSIFEFLFNDGFERMNTAGHAFLLEAKRNPDEMRTLLKKVMEDNEDDDEDPLDGIEEIHFTLEEVVLFSLDQSGSLIQSKVLERSVGEELQGIRMNPKFPIVAYGRSQGDDDEDTVSLQVRSMDDGEPRLVSGGVCSNFEWSPDGRELIYMVKSGKVQWLQKAEVASESGKLPDDESPEIKKSDLAAVFTPFRPRVAVRPSGEILFASQPVSWPSLASAEQAAPKLYLLDADGESLKEVPTADGDIPTNLGYFVLSPDGAKVALVESDSDAVAVVELESGKAELVSKPHPEWKCRTMPSWRNSQELSFVALDDKGKPNWYLRDSSGDLQSLSETWKADTLKDWMEHNPKSEPDSPEPDSPEPDSPEPDSPEPDAP